MILLAVFAIVAVVSLNLFVVFRNIFLYFNRLSLFLCKIKHRNPVNADFVLIAKLMKNIFESNDDHSWRNRHLLRTTQRRLCMVLRRILTTGKR